MSEKFFEVAATNLTSKLGLDGIRTISTLDTEYHDANKLTSETTNTIDTFRQEISEYRIPLPRMVFGRYGIR